MSDGGRWRLKWVLDLAARTSGDWPKCADAWWRACEVAQEVGATDVEKEALLKALDAYRRADLPIRVIEIVERREPHAVSKSESAMLAVYRLGALLDLGRISDALAGADELLDLATDRYTRSIAIDTVASLWLISGRIGALRSLIEEFDGGVGAAGLAKLFRIGQLARLDGDYELASTSFENCVKGLVGHEKSSGGAGAALVELGRTYSVQGMHNEALKNYEKGAVQWGLAGRVGERYRALSYGARAMLSLGNVHFLSSGLSNSVQYARDHGLALLEAECRLARGLSRHECGEDGAVEDLNASVYMSWECGARLQTGESRIERFSAGSGEDNDLAKASLELADDLPMLERLGELLRPSINDKLLAKEDR
tara:strand:+ start:1742 stop:2848 length:1107 start_codon:yes stop_codon:yes gene_type:complete